MQMLFAQIRNKLREVGVGLGIDGEGAILDLVVDVKVEHVRGNSVVAQTSSDLASLRFRSVAVAGLLESERPQRRKRRRPGEISVGFNHFFRRGAVEHVVIERAAFGAESNRVPRLLAEVKPGAPRIIEKDAVTSRTVDAQKKRNALIKWIDGFL